MDTILGVDQSYTSSGYCVIGPTNLVTDIGVFKTDKNLDIYSRALKVSEFVISKIQQHKVNHLVLEGLAFGMTGNSTRDLAGLLFTVMTNVRSRKIKVIESIVAPTALKKFATGSGTAAKGNMYTHVPTEVKRMITDGGLKKTTGMYDACDAYWLARYGISISSGNRT